MNDLIIATTFREGKPDCIHMGTVVVVNDQGDLLYSLGNSQKLVFERSTTKPYKVTYLVEKGIHNKNCWQSSELAIIAGSHSGSQMHVQKLMEMLLKLNLEPEKLHCGSPLPIDNNAILEMIAIGGISPSPLYSDCSGEHIGILALCLDNGWDINNYNDIGHPAQATLRQEINHFIEYEPVDYSIDGCGEPTYFVPLYRLALGMANFCGKKMSKSAKTVIDAIIDEPDYYAGSGRFASELIKTTKGRVIAKDGAEGLCIVGWPSEGIGLAVKVADGNYRAIVPTVLAVIKRLKLLDHNTLILLESRLEHYINIKTNSGADVGVITSTL